VKVNTEFVLNKEGTEAGAGKVFAEGLLSFTKIKVTFLNAGT
jgi:hypothetical protein